jgi:hypothetical protein
MNQGLARFPMSFMFEVYYKSPADSAKEAALARRVAGLGGRLDYREDVTEHTGICLTFEFDDRDRAMQAAEALRQFGEHVEGPMDYAA